MPERRVGDRKLERSGKEITLADGEVDVVAHRPGAIGVAVFEQLVAPLGRGDAADGLAWHVESGHVAEAERLRPVLDELVSVVVDVLLQAAAERVEVDVRGDLERVAQCERPVGHLTGIQVLLLAHLVETVVVDDLGRREPVGVKCRQRGDWA